MSQDKDVASVVKLRPSSEFWGYGVHVVNVGTQDAELEIKLSHKRRTDLREAEKKRKRRRRAQIDAQEKKKVD